MQAWQHTYCRNGEKMASNPISYMCGACGLLRDQHQIVKLLGPIFSLCAKWFKLICKYNNLMSFQFFIYAFIVLAKSHSPIAIQYMNYHTVLNLYENWVPPASALCHHYNSKHELSANKRKRTAQMQSRNTPTCAKYVFETDHPETLIHK